ncbi:MAG: Gfo/Idh/MocA family oxidoreductase, partial [bacterium]|nr:Gfo/Idh/MocA family oxidoreductase [bacterium]
MTTKRRDFLKGSVAAAALSRSRVLGANDRIRVAGLGCGGRTQYLLGKINQLGGCEIVALADVYKPRNRQAKARVAPHAKEYVDYHKLLERTDIDAVVIGSPDHWHVPMTIDSIQAGKDVYVEKPVSHTIEEGERLNKVAAASDRVVQIGYQQRSWDHFQHARHLIQSGKLGKITLVLASWYQTYLALDPSHTSVNAAELDWKRWLGSAPATELIPERYHRWRWFWDYGGGHLTDLYSHWCDTIHWLMDVDTPLSTQAMGGRYAFDFQECPDTINTAWEYPGKFAVTYQGTMHCHLEGGNIVFRGDQALMKLNRDGFTVYPEGVVPKEKTHYPEPEIAVRSIQDGPSQHVR